jgi:hypothetical protein
MYRVLAFLPVLALLAGCAEHGTVDMEQQRVIRDAEPDEVFAAAATVLQREFGSAKLDRGSHRIDTAPVEFSTQRESGTARDLYRGRSTMRRTAHFSVGRTGGQTVARLRIDVDRRDTERQAVMQPRPNRLSDTPGQETPIDNDAATTAEQNSVWTRVRRDRALERALLDELRELFSRRASETENPASAPASTTPGQP